MLNLINIYRKKNHFIGHTIEEGFYDIPQHCETQLLQYKLSIKAIYRFVYRHIYRIVSISKLHNGFIPDHIDTEIDDSYN
jgi:hypothetical protein